MRILITTDTIGGVWTYSRNLCQGLLRRGCEVLLVGLGRWPSLDQSDCVRETQKRYGGNFEFVASTFKLEWMRDYSEKQDESISVLLDLIGKNHPDLLHSNQFAYGDLPTEIPKVVVAHSEVLSWMSACEVDWREDAQLARYRRLVDRGLRGASVVVFPSEWMKAQILKFYGRVFRAAVVHNGSGFVAKQGKKKMQVVSCGRMWDRGKNAAALQKADLQLPVYVAGELSFEGHEEPMSGLTYLGPLPPHELQALLIESAIYVATSVYEPFGLAPLEAALCGCAIVANDIPSLREIWGDAALYFDGRENHRLEDIVGRLQSDCNLLHQKSEAALRRAQERYGLEPMIDSYLAIYKEVVTSNVSAFAS